MCKKNKIINTRVWGNMSLTVVSAEMQNNLNSIHTDKFDTSITIANIADASKFLVWLKEKLGSGPIN